MHGNREPLTLFDVEALIYVQEAQLDKFRRELVISSDTANVAHTNQ